MADRISSIASQVLVGAILGGLSGAMCVGCVTPHNLWLLAPLAFAPFTIACCTGSWMRAVSAGAAHGLVVAIGCLSFVLPALHRTASLSWPVSIGLWLLVAATHSLRAVAAAGLARSLLKYWQFPLLVVPAAWVLAEWMMPVMFPWPAAAIAQGYSPWLQLAEIGGPLLVSYWIVAAGAGIGAAAIRWRRGWRCFTMPLALTVVVVAVASCFGMLLESGARSRMAAAPGVLLGVVQGGSPKDNDQEAFQLYRKRSLDLVAKNPGVGLLVWPETISPAPAIERDLETYLRNYVRTDRREGDKSQVLDVPVLLGLNIFRAASTPAGSKESSVQPSYLTNSMVLFDGSGRVTGRYNKQVLVPIGEAAIRIALPRIGTWEVVAPVTRYHAEKSDQLLRVAGHGLSTVICYEDMLPSYVRQLVNDSGSELLVSASSDGWFEGEHPRRLHFMLAALRAVETRRYLLRVTRDGMSGLVTPIGQIAWSLPNHVLASGVVSARWVSGKTLYVRVGDLPMLLLSALTILLGAAFSRGLRSSIRNWAAVFRR